MCILCSGINNNRKWYSATSWPAWPNTRAVSTPRTNSRTSKCSTTYRRRLSCWPITIRSTVLCSRGWTACSNSWVTSPRTAESDWSATCTTTRRSLRRSVTWCLHSWAGTLAPLGSIQLTSYQENKQTYIVCYNRWQRISPQTICISRITLLPLNVSQYSVWTSLHLAKDHCWDPSWLSTMQSFVTIYCFLFYSNVQAISILDII